MASTAQASRPATAAVLVNLGAYLRSVRKAKGWTPEQVAFKCDLHPTYVAAVERGRYNVTVLTLRKITSALGITITEAMSGAEGRPTPKLKRSKRP